jgi:hypothetical protein
MPQSEAAGASITTMQTMTTTEIQGDLEWSCSMLQPPSALHSHDDDDDVRELDQKKTFRDSSRALKTFRDSSRALRAPFKGVPLEV